MKSTLRRSLGRWGVSEEMREWGGNGERWVTFVRGV